MTRTHNRQNTKKNRKKQGKPASSRKGTKNCKSKRESFCPETHVFFWSVTPNERNKQPRKVNPKKGSRKQTLHIPPKPSHRRKGQKFRRKNPGSHVCPQRTRNRISKQNHSEQTWGPRKNQNEKKIVCGVSKEKKE